MSHDDLQRWLNAYVAAWESRDPAAIGDLYSEDVVYKDYPFQDALIGRDAVVANWLGKHDEPGSFQAVYEPVAVDGYTAVARGTSTYFDSSGGIASLYHNVFVMRFDDDGRCKEWTEYYSRDPQYGE